MLALLAVPRAAFAAEQQPIRLDLRAPADCPDANAFLGQILERAPNTRAATPAESARSFQVSIERAGPHFIGKLETDSLSHTEGKVVQAKSCVAVVSALAAAVALSLDVNEPDAKAPNEAATQAPPSAAPPVPPESRSTPARPSATSTAPPVRQWGAAIDAAVLARALPLMAGATGSLSWRSASQHFFSPTLRLGVGALTDLRPSRDVALTALLVSVSLCPTRAALSTVTFAVCARNVTGWLHGRARVRSSGSGAWLLLGATGAEARLELALGPMFLEAGFGVLGVWSQPSFRSEPSAAALQATGGLMLDGTAGVGAFF